MANLVYGKSVRDMVIEEWAEDLGVKDLVREVMRLREIHREDGEWTDKLNAEIRELRKNVKSLVIATQMKDAVIRELNEKLEKFKKKYGDLDY